MQQYESARFLNTSIYWWQFVVYTPIAPQLTKLAMLAKSFGDPKGIWFEPFLAHFEQLRQMYENIEEEESNV